MELKDFVASSLTQIAEGIAQAQVSAQGAYRISPRHVGPEKDAVTHIERQGDSLECVNFDIAVSTKSAQEKDAKAKIYVVSGGLQSRVEDESLSRIQFQVYVQWPRQQ